MLLPLPQILPYQDRDDPTIRGEAVAGYGHLSLSKMPWQLRDGESEGAFDCVKSSHTRRVLTFEETTFGEAPLRLFAKRNRSRNWRKGLGYRFRGSKARREWKIGWEILRRGIITGRPVVWAQRISGGLIRESYLITESIRADATLIDHLKSLPDEKSRASLMPALAAFVHSLHDVGFYHDDLSSEHIWVARGDAPTFGIIDLDQSVLGRSVSPSRRDNNLHQVLRSIPVGLLNRNSREAFLSAYFGDAWPANRDAVIQSLTRIQQRKGSEGVLG